MREVNREDIPSNTAQKMMFSIKDYFSNCNQIWGVKKIR